ncbi:hypothetical protein STCU_02124 [Strigomonas culicis]|uniref:Uncharacterized protein n=1 Tax=Strigomonas culicis TaxID=28005 RepID=S9W2S7_9TRYP|nr:hypothetical protein STCU_02124 [Strigomonas culicis]|eukprot:EPY33626.1 hypothetical protein STCU_02124 [Strigomonas culicis]
MGRGFGRGAKSVAIVTHAQVKSAGKKTPRGLRSVRQKKKQRYQKKHDQDGQEELEKSLGLSKQEKNMPMTMAQQIAAIQVPHIINKRQKGLKQLRKQIIAAVKNVRRSSTEKGKRKAQKQIEKMQKLQAKKKSEDDDAKSDSSE